MKISSILGLNARSRLYSYIYNPAKSKKIASSKLMTSRILRQNDIATPKIIAKFIKPGDINKFEWENLPGSFALKPSKGLGGEGIIIIKKKLKNKKDYFLTTQKERINIDDLKLNILDILEGAYSVGHVPDAAFIQEYVGRHKTFRKLAYRGTPDIRVIVFNKVPIMAMLRLPTKESGGRANLHQGAIGVGIDIGAGITTKAIWHGNVIHYKPESNAKLSGVKIPQWDKILEMAVKSQLASGLGYVGVDIVLHPEKGPMVLELNAHPGLQIQLANMTGLKKRLERVEDLEVKDSVHGIKIAKALFAGRFPDRSSFEEGIKKVSVWEEIKILAKNNKKFKAFAKIDTGAWRTSIDKSLALKLGLINKENILWARKIRTSIGREERQVINLTFFLAGRRIETIASVSTRVHMRVAIIIGRRDLSGFLVNSYRDDKPLNWVPKMWKG